MTGDREKNIFLIVSWVFLVGSLAFFISFVSLGRIILPPAAWITFLLIDLGCIVFMFLPQTGRVVYGPGGGAPVGDGWYPQNLADIVEPHKIENGEKPGKRPLVRPVSPVPFIPLVLMLVVIVLALPLGMNEEEWQGREVARLRGIYGQARDEISRLEEGILDLARRTAETFGESGIGASDDGGRTAGDAGVRSSAASGSAGEDGGAADGRARMIGLVDSLAAAFSEDVAPFGDVGIQVYSRRGERRAWGGRPRYLGGVSAQVPGERVFTSKTQLYTLLVCLVQTEDGGAVVVDIPLEVNYRIQNRYLQSMSLGEILGRRYGVDLGFNFSMGEHGGEMRWADESLKEPGADVLYNAGSGVQVYGIVLSSTGLPIARLSVLGDPFTSLEAGRERTRGFWAGVCITLAVLVIGFWIYRIYGKRRSPERGRFWHFFKRLAVFLAFLVLVRFLLLRLDIPSGVLGTNLFDPALFADDFPGGLMQTAGDFFVTSLFVLLLVFGAIKTFRTYYGGHLERPVTAERPLRIGTVLLRAVSFWAVLSASAWLTRGAVSRVVLNSNPRLVGLDVALFDPPVFVIHLALLFLVSAILLAALFLLRLILVRRPGRIVEFVLPALAAVIGAALALGLQWAMIVAVAGLMLLSAAIFPLIKKEEVGSVIFSSFFLVLICTLAVYSVASHKYGELRRSRVLEKAQDFNYPEDNWLQVVLPDLCSEMSEDRRLYARIRQRSEPLAFEIWAESYLSRFNLSCVFAVHDAGGDSFSRFEVGMPFALEKRPPPVMTGGPVVERFEQETREGAVYFYRGIAPIYTIRGDVAGWIEITIPYFFENPELLARTGPTAPDILQNVERGAFAPRVDEPEDLLVARVSGGRVVDSSDPLLPAGTKLGAAAGEWFNIDLGRDTYRANVQVREEGDGFLIGYRISALAEKLLQWAAIVSLDVLMTLACFLVIMLLERIPVVGRVMPAIQFSGGPGFREKLLLSFMVVSVLPVVILGIFSTQYIQQRFHAEGEGEALEGAGSAFALIDHSIRSEAESFAGSQYLRDILQGKTDARIRDVAMHEITQFTLFDHNGTLLLDESLSDFGQEEISLLAGGPREGKLTVSYEHPHLYGGVVVPVLLPGGPDGHLYYRRRLDDGFVGDIAATLGKDVNIYYGGRIAASSERELFIGGLLDPLLAPAVFSSIALGGSTAMVRQESLGDYSYHVASAPIASLTGGERGVLSVPLLYQPALVRKELLRTSALVLGLMALLFATTITLGFFMAGKIFTPIAALIGGTRRIIDGDLSFRLESRAPDEIGELVDSFNSMTAALGGAQRRLIERQRYLAAVLDNVATGVIASDSEGRIITLSPAGERILKVNSAEVVGRPPRQIGREELEPLLDLFAGEGAGTGEREFTLFSGPDKRTIKAVVAGLEAGGERLGTVVVFDDLTELIRSKKLSAWIEMARQIAHEVKNPLTPLRLSAQLMQRAYREKSDQFGEIFESGVDTVLQQTDILRRIASEFSSFGRVSDLEIRPVPLAGFLEDFIASYRGMEHIEIDFGGGDGEITAMADREGLRKVLVNLVENAIEAMPGGGSIGIRCHCSGGEAVISVADTGAGLSADVEDRLFEPYFSTKTTGTGLGLAICRNLVHEMEGTITLRNREDGRGVEAVVTLPLGGEQGES